MTSVGVAVPFRSDDPERVRIFQWVAARWEALYPDAAGVVMGDGAEAGPFNRSRAVNRAVAATPADVVIIADADIAIRHGQVEAMTAALDRGAPWVVGYGTMTHLARRTTAVFMSHGPATPMAESPAGGVRWMSTESVCGLVAVRREDYLSIGGNDERFAGWGWEDSAFAAKADTLLGPHVRIPGECIHLFHALRQDRKSDSSAVANRALGMRYDKAAGDPVLMTHLVREAINVAAW